MAHAQLLYLSDPVALITLEDLLAIQAVSIRKNARQNITGILFHARGNFVQFLEGEQADIRELFETIRHDARHTNVRLLYERPADERIFDEWHMAMLDLDLHGEDERRDLQELIRRASTPSSRTTKTASDLEILCRFRELLMFA